MPVLPASLVDHVRPLTSRRPTLRRTRLLPSSYVADLRTRLDHVHPGRSRAVGWYVGEKVAAGLVVASVLVASGLRLGSPAFFILPVAAMIATWVVPDLVLYERAADRERNLELQLPEVLDQLTITVEAGFSLESAIACVVVTTKGPAVDQLAVLLRDLRHGLPCPEALTALAEGTKSPDLRRFADATARAGTDEESILAALRVQSGLAREDHSAKGETRVNGMALQLALPLVLCVVPAVVLVLVGPAIIHITDGLG